MQIGQIRSQVPVRRLGPNSTGRVQLPDRFKALILLRMHEKYSAIYRNPSEIIKIWLCRSKVENKAKQAMNSMLTRQRICVQSFFYRAKILALKNKQTQGVSQQYSRQIKEKLKKASKQQFLPICAKCKTEITQDNEELDKKMNRNYSGYFGCHKQLLQAAPKQQKIQDDDGLVRLEERIMKLNIKVLYQIMNNLVLEQKTVVFSALKGQQQ